MGGRVCLVVLWGIWLSITWVSWLPFHRQTATAWLALPAAVLVLSVFSLQTLVLARRHTAPPIGVAVMLSGLLSSCLGLFAGLYWSIGTRANFTHSLTRLDAIYFAVGTLSTAGTGTISATSQTARLFRRWRCLSACWYCSLSSVQP
jgi:hypothetical protein